MANPARARLREFHPLELILAMGGTVPWWPTRSLVWTVSKRAHTETTVLGQLKKSQQNRAPACESRHITDHRETFCGPAEFAGSAHGVFGFMPARSHQPEYLE
jgi:hypothetical protein